MMIIDKYRKIINQLIDKSFPDLRYKRIFIIKFRSKKFVGGAIHPLPYLRLLFINPYIKKQYIKSIMVHELSHLEIFEKRGWIKYCLIEFAYWYNKELRRKEEIETDKLAIKKGYAKELYKLAKYLQKNKNRRYLFKYYLSINEIKSYAKSIGKW